MEFEDILFPQKGFKTLTERLLRYLLSPKTPQRFTFECDAVLNCSSEILQTMNISNIPNANYNKCNAEFRRLRKKILPQNILTHDLRGFFSAPSFTLNPNCQAVNVQNQLILSEVKLCILHYIWKEVVKK